MLLILDSKNKLISSDNTNSYTVNLRNNVETTAVTLKSLRINYTWYNITDANNKFTVKLLVLAVLTTFSITLTVGCYDLQTLLLELTNELNQATSLFFNVQENDRTGLITISEAGIFEISWQNSLDKYLGFVSTQTLSGLTTYTTANVSEINDPVYLKLDITGISNGITTNNTNQSAGSFIVELNDTYRTLKYNDLLQYNNLDDHKLYAQHRNTIEFNNFKVSLFDSNNSLLLNNNSNWFCILELR